MFILFRSVLSILIVFLIAIASYADDKTPKIEQLAEHFRMKKPEGEGPFPAVMIVPGCTGFAGDMSAHYERIHDNLVELGFVTLRIDWMTVRRGALCWEVDHEKVAKDIDIVAEYLHRQNFVKKNEINVIGWSYGGECVLQALKETKNRKPVKVNAAIAYYPGCWLISRWDSKIPVLVLLGASDNISPVSDCENLFKKLKNPEKLTLRIYDDAHHRFDDSDLPSEIKRSYGTVGYNESAAKSAWSEVTNFLRK